MSATPPSPPKGLPNSPSIFAYQTRLLQRTSSTSQNGGNRHTPGSSSISSLNGMTSLASMANSSPPSTPIRRSVARMIAEGKNGNGPDHDDTSKNGFGRSGSGRDIGLGIGLEGKPEPTHARSSRSVDLVRGRWESKISEASGDSAPVTPKSLRSSTFSPPMPPPTSIPSRHTPSSTSHAANPLVPSETGTSTMSRSATESPSSGQYRSAFMASRANKRTTVSGTDDLSRIPSTTSTTSESSQAESTFRARPASISSYTSVLSPNSTGDSSVVSGRSQANEDRLARAKANALRRRQEKAAAEAGLTGTSPVPSTPPRPANVETITPKPLEKSTSTSKQSPFANLFEPPEVDETPKRPSTILATPTSALSTRSSLDPAVDASPVPVSRYVPSGLSAGPSSGFGPAPSSSKDKYGSISKTDRRRLGRHLPRIASGGEGWEEDGGTARLPSGHGRIPSSLGKQAGAAAATENDPPIGDATVRAAPISTPSTPASRPRATDVLTPSTSANVPPSQVPSTPTTASKRRSAYMSSMDKPSLPTKVGLNSPRPEVAGAEMKGLMSAVGSTATRGGPKDDGEGVTGMSNRLRLSRATLPPSASSASLAPAPLPSRRLMQTNWMDRQRHAIAAYEYLCHVGEAQQWIEGCLDEELGFGVTELEDGLVDGVVLAKLAQKLQDKGVVRNIYTEGKHRYKQTENINHFLRFIRSVGMPETFIWETTDLYNKRNVPKVIFSIHVLSHLLARLGRAERIGNLVGQFEFTDEQLAATQKGLQGVAMPNFGDARNTLAKEASWEPEEPEETEDERRDRELLECEPSIIKLQCHLRGRLAKQRIDRVHAQLDLAQPIITRLQARSRGAMSRRTLMADRDERAQLRGWSTSLQAVASAHLARKRWISKTKSLRQSENAVIGIQAHARGMLARVRQSSVQTTLDKSHKAVVGIQAMCRGCLARKAQKAHRSSLASAQTINAITTLQAVLRGRLRRQALAKQQVVVTAQAATYTSLQSHLRGALVRRRQRALEAKVDDATTYIVAIQATARGVLARRKKQGFVSNLQQSFPVIPSLQAMARGRLARKSHQTMQKALAKVEVAGSVGGLQAFLRTKLAKKQATEQKKKLEFVQPDVIGFQAVARGYLARQEYREWRDYLQDPHTQGALVFLQSLIRGFLARRRLYQRTSYIHQNVDKIIKVQALWRGRTERQMYQKLVTGQDVDVATIQNYMHLLDDTEGDSQDQIRTETLRKEVMDLIRENQALETEVKELDTKIALIVNNKMTFEELARAKRRAGATKPEDTQFHHHVNPDPFSTGAHLDRASQRKLELFQHLFFTLQTKPEYLSRLLRGMAKDENADKDRRMVESVMLILFGYERREEYLFHKLLQLSVHEEVLRSSTLSDLSEARFATIPVASQYIKPNLTPYLQFVLDEHVMRVIQATELDLVMDPVELYHRSIAAEEAATGFPSTRPRNLDGDQVLQTDAIARAEYIQHLQELRFLCDRLVKTLIRSTTQMPYTVRLLARETLLALRVKYRDAYDEDLTPIIARTVILPFILPALIAPETYGIVDQPIGPIERKNLAAIANLLTHIAAQDFSPSTKDRFVRTPLQEYIRSDGGSFRDWVIDVADVEPLEGYFQAHEMLESTLESKPISITRNDIYGMLSILIRNVPVLTGGKQKDALAKVLEELEGPPIDYDRSKTLVMLRLTNRFAEVKPGDNSRIKEDWVQAKRHVLAVLRVQTGRTLFDVLTSRPEEIDELRWIEEVHRDIALENARRMRLPPTPVEAEYQIESIRSLPFHEVKSRAIVYCMNLEKASQISRSDNFNALLVSIASDIQQKHHLRKMQKQNLVAMTRAHDDLRAKKAKFDEQIQSYHDYIDSSMASLQAKGKKKPMFLSKQYRHQRALAKEGKNAQFGSYAYTATELYEKGILLGISQFSPRQYDKVNIIISSNEVGVFALEMNVATSSATGSTIGSPGGGGGSQLGGHGGTIVGREEVRMEDLLQAQFDNEQNLLLFEGMATFSINMLVHQINKKFYA